MCGSFVRLWTLYHLINSCKFFLINIQKMYNNILYNLIFVVLGIIHIEDANVPYIAVFWRALVKFLGIWRPKFWVC